MNRPLFFSGWAGVRELFPLLSAQCDCVVPFLDAEPEDMEKLLLSGGGTPLIGWSTGAHIILKHLPVVTRLYPKIILAAPFTAFTRHTDARVLKLMIKGLQRDFAGTVAQFHQNCGADPVSVDTRHAEALEKGLHFLLQSSTTVFEQPAENVTIIHGNRDKIVPRTAGEELLEYLNGAHFIPVDSGHMIPERTILSVLGVETT